MNTAYANSVQQGLIRVPAQREIEGVLEALNAEGSYSSEVFTLWWPAKLVGAHAGVSPPPDVRSWRFTKWLASMSPADIAGTSRALRKGRHLQARFWADREDLGNAQGVLRRRLQQHVDGWLANGWDLPAYLEGTPKRLVRSVRKALSETLASILKRGSAPIDEATFGRILQLKPPNQEMEPFLREVFAKPRRRRGLQRPVIEAERTADLLFAVLVLSPRSKDVGRCRRAACGLYFVGQPKKRQKRYCSDLCRTIESGKRSAKERRRRENQEKLRRLEEACTKWNVRRRSGNDPKQWMADRAGVSLTWLTRALKRGWLKLPPVGRNKN